MDYTVEITTKAARSVRKLETDVQARVKAAIEDLGGDPRPPGAVKLSGSIDTWRIRVGAYRIVYDIDDKERLVLVLDVFKRGDSDGTY